MRCTVVLTVTVLCLAAGLADGHAQPARWPSEGWVLAVEGGTWAVAQQDDYLSLLTYGGTGATVAAQIRREGRWQHGADLFVHRATATPRGDAVDPVVDRSLQITGGGAAVLVRRRVVRRTAWRLHAGLHADATGTTWSSARAGGVPMDYDVFATLATEAQADWAWSRRDRLTARLTLPLAAYAYRPSYIGGGSEGALVTWPDARGLAAQLRYVRRLSEQFEGRVGYRVRGQRSGRRPALTRLAHRFLLGLAVRL
jgi:hypothetical protein